jgi:hypothetical protein
MTGSAHSQRASARDTEQLVMRHAELVKRIAYHLPGACRLRWKSMT